MTSVTVLGLGAMGRALAAAFVAAGHSTTVWNRTPGRDVPGASAAATPAEAITASPLVIACLLDDESVHRVLDPVVGDLAGRTLVNLTTSTPAQARAMAEWAATHEIDFLDGGIMATPPMIATPAGFILYSGSAPAFAAGEQALAALGAAHYVGADAGRAALFDLALLSAMYSMLGGVYHALALVRADGVSAADLQPFLSSWLSAVLGILPEVAKQTDAGTVDDSTAGLDMQAAAYHKLIDLAHEQRVRPDFVTPMNDLLRRALAAGGTQSFADLLQVDATESGTRGF